MKIKPKILLIIFIIMIISINCGIISIPNINVSNVKLGTDINNDGFLISEVEIIPPTIEIIYLQFDLNAPVNMEIPLDYKWYHDNILFLNYSEIHTTGPITATLRRQTEIAELLPEGFYRVEVWYLNTLLIQKTFSIQK